MREEEPAAGIEEGQLEAAKADLGRIREALESAARGEADATELTRSIREYLDQHGPALRTAAAAVGEEVRQQLLEQLHRWRSQVDDQLGSRRRPPLDTPPGNRSGADPPERLDEEADPS